MTDTDPALEWFLADAKSQGLTISEYERRYAVILTAPRSTIPYAAEARIRAHEIPAGLMTDGEVSVATDQARRRSTRSCATDPSAIRPGLGSSAHSSGPRTPRRANPARACAPASVRGGWRIAA